MMIVLDGMHAAGFTCHMLVLYCSTNSTPQFVMPDSQYGASQTVIAVIKDCMHGLQRKP